MMGNGALQSRPKIVVIGCGFGGLEATKALRHAPVDVVLIDRTNHHLFQPLLYQVATAGLAAPAIAEPTRHLLRKQRNVTVLLGEVCDVDAPHRTLHLADGSRLPYDVLIVAAGATHSTFGHDDWAAHMLGLKTLDDAFAIRRRLLMGFERAEAAPDAPDCAALLTCVVVGAGPTGVEMAGTIAEIARHTLPGEFRRIDPRRARVVLVEGGARVLAAHHPKLSDSALRQLRQLGVEVMLNSTITDIDAHGVQVRQGDATLRIDAHTVIWAAGVAASPLGHALAQSAGAPLDRAGRVQVQPDLTVPGHPEIFVVGDLASASSHAPGRAPQPVPGVSPAAKQMGRLAAANALRQLRGAPMQAFRYRDYGMLATIGRKAAVADVPLPGLGRLRFGGVAAWLFWLFVHIYFLIGFRNRLVVMIDWAWSYWSFARHARVVTGSDREGAHARDA